VKDDDNSLKTLSSSSFVYEISYPDGVKENVSYDQLMAIIHHDNNKEEEEEEEEENRRKLVTNQQTHYHYY